jgi:catechol 2,3-dioxygenase
MTTKPLDVQSLLNQNGKGKWDDLPSGTTIGHVHLYVSNLLKAKAFYHDLLGLYLTASLPGAYFFASDGYHHHIATNTWIGTNLMSNSADDYDKTGLAYFAIRIPGNYKQEELRRLKNYFTKNGVLINEKLGKCDNHNDFLFYAYDPFGIKIQFLSMI